MSFKFWQRWWLHYFHEDPVPEFDHPLSEEIFTNIQSKLPLVQLEAMSSYPVVRYLGEMLQKRHPHLLRRLRWSLELVLNAQIWNAMEEVSMVRHDGSDIKRTLSGSNSEGHSAVSLGTAACGAQKEKALPPQASVKRLTHIPRIGFFRYLYTDRQGH